MAQAQPWEKPASIGTGLPPLTHPLPFPSYLQALLMKACHQAPGLSHPHQGQVFLPNNCSTCLPFN